MSFNILKNLRVQNGNVYKFNNYKIYMIPNNKLKLGISPFIDRFINKKLSLSNYCKKGVGESISNQYIYSILDKKDTLLFFVTQTITTDKEIWENETLNEDLITKLQTMDLEKNVPYFNFLRKQLGLPVITVRAIKSLKKRFLSETIEKIRQQILTKSSRSSSNVSRSRSSRSRSRSSRSRSNSVSKSRSNRSESSRSKSNSVSKSNISNRSTNRKSGGGFVSKSVTEEHLISFMFVEKQTSDDYYIKVQCTSKIIDFAEESPEYNFPWATYFLYIFLKSMGNKSINIYNDASNRDVIYYHKRFLFNLGNKKCSETDEIYEQSLEIPFDVLKGPDVENKKLYEELIKSLPDSYETKSGFRMKVCDIQKDINVKNINNVEEYLKSKWNKTFNLSRLSISRNSIKSKSIKNTSSRTRSLTSRSLTTLSNSNTSNSVKKSKKLGRRHSYNF